MTDARLPEEPWQRRPACGGDWELVCGRTRRAKLPVGLTDVRRPHGAHMSHPRAHRARGAPSHGRRSEAAALGPGQAAAKLAPLATS